MLLKKMSQKTAGFLQKYLRLNARMMINHTNLICDESQSSYLLLNHTSLQVTVMHCHFQIKKKKKKGKMELFSSIHCFSGHLYSVFHYNFHVQNRRQKCGGVRNVHMSNQTNCCTSYTKECILDDGRMLVICVHLAHSAWGHCIDIWAFTCLHIRLILYLRIGVFFCCNCCFSE